MTVTIGNYKFNVDENGFITNGYYAGYTLEDAIYYESIINE